MWQSSESGEFSLPNLMTRCHKEKWDLQQKQMRQWARSRNLAMAWKPSRAWQRAGSTPDRTARREGEEGDPIRRSPRYHLHIPTHITNIHRPAWPVLSPPEAQNQAYETGCSRLIAGGDFIGAIMERDGCTMYLYKSLFFLSSFKLIKKIKPHKDE